ncbi:NACHT, LRR and PYD domains-containing protein 1b allele 2-like isoform X2 [Chelonoidis abingdonii]|uniref:NACHT, LRR and PYD domains-containing protein 1b allele 2-like isoform X2 n=1 Tax=Chelonoidis abingdonii TaxID=106734 RepID=UPI0013F1E5CF|nr:NACHT, LRR and PYD domains-containing protein 1b allele 2-like isoform X2 [Chelonoidis abingdonii]
MRTGAGGGTVRELSVDSRDDPTAAGSSCLPLVQHGHMDVPHDQISTRELTSASGIICQQTLLTSTDSVAVASGETNWSQSPTACLRGQHKCNWCAREEDLPEEIKPEIIWDLDRNQETYRVHFSRAGWFCCPETELEFEVRAAVTIQYGYSSWREHLTETQKNQWMVAGPLFDIRVEPTEAVAAVHLPHFLCLRDADNSRMQIAHFIDEGMTLENPTRVRSFHAVLENPSFSPIGVFWRRENSDQRTQLHSIVLLYQAQRRVNLTLHLYLIPDDGSRVKAVKDYEKECQSWFVSKSHFTAKPLHFDSLYIVSSPSEITVTPKELPFLDKPAEAFQPFTEVHTTDVKKELELSLVGKKDGKPIWEAVIRPEDLAPSGSSIKMQIDTHFVDQHREQLIKRVTAVDSILDSLHGVVLDPEQYQSIRAERTNPDKMRKLYELVPSWNSGCKEKLYQALKDKHRHLVEQLEEK